MSKPSGSCPRLDVAIEKYLIAHPGAADTDQGITDWWVAEMGIEASVGEVMEALELLLRNGIVEMQVMPDGKALYRARRNPNGALS